MATYPLSTLACTITAVGISAPTYAEIYESLRTSFFAIYGSDSYIDPDSKDGQLLAVFARAFADANDATIATFQSFSPATAQGVALSNNVRLNGIARQQSSNSSAVLEIAGTVGTLISLGFVRDAAGNQWALPPSVEIPLSGILVVTAVCVTPGAVAAPSGTITGIVTPTLGWQTVNNPEAAAPGASVETDADLRRRQTTSTALSSKTVLDGIEGAIAALDGVLEVRGYENDTDATNADGLPEHSIALVVRGGDAEAIATILLQKKGPGVYTYGTIVLVVLDPNGRATTIRFFAPTDVTIVTEVKVRAKAGYSTASAQQIKIAVAAYQNNLGIGVDAELSRLYLPALLYGADDSKKYEVVSVQQARIGQPLASADINIAFNERAAAAADNVTVTVVT